MTHTTTRAHPTEVAGPSAWVGPSLRFAAAVFAATREEKARPA